MRIILATCGSRGDVQPMIALTLALKAKGHDCLLLGPPEKKQWADTLGCPYAGFGQDVTGFIESFDHPLNIKSITGFHQFVQDALEDQLKCLSGFVRNAELIVASSLFFGAAAVAQVFEIPYRYIVFSPQVLPSARHPFPIIRTQTLPACINRMSWKLSVFFDRPFTLFKLNRFLRKAGLPLIRDAWRYIIGRNPILACDPQIAGIPDDVAMDVTQTGYLHLKSHDPLNPDISLFLQQHRRVIYAGFGSMPGKDQRRHVQMLIRVAKKNKTAVVIAAPWQHKITDRIKPDVLLVKHCPHYLVYPGMQAVIHHGGAGTTAVAALSGVPQIIVPHILDQYYNAFRVHRRNLGPEPVWRSALSEGKLIKALDRALNDLSLIQNAAHTARHIDPDAALHKAVASLVLSDPA